MISIDKKLEILDVLLDDRCDSYGVRNMIQWLINIFDATDQELTDLKFDPEDIEVVRESIKKDPYTEFIDE